MTTHEEAQLCAVIDQLSNVSKDLCLVINGIDDITTQLKQILLDSEEAYLARTDHICKCKECGNHDE